MKLMEKTLEEKTIYEGHILKLSVDTVELPDGRRGTREVVHHPGGVGVVALDANGDVLLVRQFRYPYKAEVLEIPAGKLSPGEDPLLCGKRELREETGACAEEYRELGTMYPSVGYTDEIISVYLARGLRFGEQELDEGEFLNVVRMPLERAVRMVLDGELPDAKTQVGLLKAWALLREKQDAGVAGGR